MGIPTFGICDLFMLRPEYAHVPGAYQGQLNTVQAVIRTCSYISHTGMRKVSQKVISPYNDFMTLLCNYSEPSL